eukprot:CAMPEP_0117651850 /NCGR_PEP_ID=MMETSP0804-20121206/2312_1 /TAXON_ID=1074897 /ORGANISM="Tetraselmis astigmatica, Strain CCMP880" /LENGTH=210 /DNA_ID=CAMNT_0005457855 /DNA_START=163 /DNA_END=795 /DNA_ORIENTATION=+
MSDSDDEAPPLQAMADQLSALKVSNCSSASSKVTARDRDAAELPVAQVAVLPEPARTAAASHSRQRKSSTAPVIKKGFFDAQPTPKARKAKTHTDKEEVTVLKGKQGGLSGPRIPEFFRLDPSEEENKLNEMKDGLVKALKPTEGTMKDVMANPDLLAGFDDPEVMAAVNEVAKDPSAMKKHTANPKVRKFYEAMGMFVGNQLEQRAAET